MSMMTALSGVNAFSQLLSTSAHNIANLSTPGFKASRTELADVYAAHGASTGIGVRAASTTAQFTQGQFDATGNTLDLSIQGDGFFTLRDSSSTVYSRNGALHLDNQGNIVNHKNQILQGYQVDANGQVSGDISDLTVDSQSLAPKATENVHFVLNLDAHATSPSVDFLPSFSASAPPSSESYAYSASSQITDNLGEQHELKGYFVPSDELNTYDVYFALDGQSIQDGAPTKLQFNSEGQLISSSESIDYSDISLSNGAQNLDLSVNFHGSTQYASPFAQYAIVDDGYTSGNLSHLNISPTGIMQASYSNGQTETIGQVALSRVNNPQGLQSLGDGTYVDTYQSGNPIFGLPGSSSFGLVQSGFLENSNTDLSSELVSLIMAQRGFQANIKALKTADAMMGSLLNIRA